MGGRPFPKKGVQGMERIKNSKRVKRITSRWQLYLFLLVPVIYILVFCYYPMTGIQLAFKKYDLNLGIWGSPWIGMDNFTKFFKSYYFKRVITNTIRLSLYSLIAGFPLPVIFALALNSMRNLKYKKFIQMVTYIPHFISIVVLVGMMLQIFNPRVGLIGVLWNAFGGTDAPDLFANENAFSHLYVWSGIWQSLGWNSIIYIAALSGVDSELHEAAQIDGASRFQRVLYVDFPVIVPTMIMLLILNAGSIMNVGFEKAYLMQNDLNLVKSEVISTYSYKVAFNSAIGDYGYSTAVGLFNSVINFFMLVVVNQISKKVSQQSLW